LKSRVLWFPFKLLQTDDVPSSQTCYTNFLSFTIVRVKKNLSISFTLSRRFYARIRDQRAILQSDRLRFLESNCQVGFRVSSSVRFSFSLILFPLLLPISDEWSRNISPIRSSLESSNLLSPHMMIEFRLVWAVTYNLTMLYQPISIPDKLGKRIMGVASTFWLLLRKLCFDVWGEVWFMANLRGFYLGND